MLWGREPSKRPEGRHNYREYYSLGLWIGFIIIIIFIHQSVIDNTKNEISKTHHYYLHGLDVRSFNFRLADSDPLTGFNRWKETLW